MANRLYPTQFQQSSVGVPVAIYMKVTFGSTGAPTQNTGSKFISGIVRNGAGDYTITFRDVYNSLLEVKHVFQTGSSTPPAAPAMFIQTNSTATASAKTLRVVFNSAGTPTDPASTEIVYLQFLFNNSSVNG